MFLPTTAHLLFPLMAALCFLSSSQQQLPALWVTQPFPVPVCHLMKANKKKDFPKPTSAALCYSTYLFLPGFFTRNLFIFLWFLCRAVVMPTNATTLYQISQASSFLYCKAPCDRDAVSWLSAVQKKRHINTFNGSFQTSVLAEERTWGKDALGGSATSRVFLGDSLLSCITAL